MASLDTVPSRVQYGDLYTLGAHRLLCADSADHEAVELLMQGERADLCFTSPPYDNQRCYTVGRINWTQLMAGVFAVLPATQDSQLFVNLGLVHRDKSWHAYWSDWIECMTEIGWNRFGWYVWNQGEGLPGSWHGRLAPCFEFVFHFNRVAKLPKKIVPCKGAGTRKLHGRGLRKQDGSADEMKSQHGRFVQTMKIPDAIVSVFREKRPGLSTAHPAVFPVGLPEFFLTAYGELGGIVYDPFGGGGTTLLAAEQVGMQARISEIEPRYCDIALARWEAQGGTVQHLARLQPSSVRSYSFFQHSLFNFAG